MRKSRPFKIQTVLCSYIWTRSWWRLSTTSNWKTSSASTSPLNRHSIHRPMHQVAKAQQQQTLAQEAAQHRPRRCPRSRLPLPVTRHPNRLLQTAANAVEPFPIGGPRQCHHRLPASPPHNKTWRGWRQQKTKSADIPPSYKTHLPSLNDPCQRRQPAAAAVQMAGGPRHCAEWVVLDGLLSRRSLLLLLLSTTTALSVLWAKTRTPRWHPENHPGRLRLLFDAAMSSAHSLKSNFYIIQYIHISTLLFPLSIAITPRSFWWNKTHHMYYNKPRASLCRTHPAAYGLLFIEV